RAEGLSQRKIATKVGVSQQRVQQILKGKKQ
ncbi:helix-turn-helix domain-containing protein, partial [Endozoicomonas sp. SM1973]|nr:helix-turn-helix domain-containing protein [Spartinivicinus marinus]